MGGNARCWKELSRVECRRKVDRGGQKMIGREAQNTQPLLRQPSRKSPFLTTPRQRRKKHFY